MVVGKLRHFAMFLKTLLIGAALAAGPNPVIIPARDIPGPTSVLIILQGEGVPSSQYVDLAEELQRQAPYPLHVVMPDFNTLIGTRFDNVHDKIAELRNSIPFGNTLPTFLAGHSIGGGAALKEALAYPNDYKATLLFGSSLSRNYSSTFPLPVLAVNGELDGFHRISRVAEHFFNRYDRKKVAINADSAKQQPIIVVEGMNHLQFSPGSIPDKYKKLDLVAEISNDDATAKVAKIVLDFFCLHNPNGCDQSAASASLLSQVQKTRTLIDPMIQAFRLESSPNLFTSCNSDAPSAHCPFYPAWPPQQNRKSSPSSDCVCGVPFSSIAATIMAGLDQSFYPVQNQDAIHDVTDTKPYHHPHIWSDCTTASRSRPCVMNSTTVSQVMYEDDPEDNSIPHATAYEIRIKMKARQAYARYSFDPNAKLDVYDKGNLCADINKKAVDWAYLVASEKAKARYDAYGTKIVMANDNSPPLPVGPLFINDKLDLDEKQVDGKWVLRVTSTSFKTPEEGNLVTKLYPDSNGYHYCKVLSPARVMEHIYVDGLRKYRGVE